MSCRICTELESSLHSAQEPPSPTALLGLTEAGERNRAQQKREKIEKLELLLQKHRANCEVARGVAVGGE